MPNKRNGVIITGFMEQNYRTRTAYVCRHCEDYIEEDDLFQHQWLKHIKITGRTSQGEVPNHETHSA